MEEILRAVVLGIVQGLTEFLPISSSGHLILTREFFGWEIEDDLTFDVALHLGTLVAVLAFFWREWWQMFTRTLLWIGTRKSERRFGQPYDEKLVLVIIIGSIPVAITGLLFEDFIEREVRSPVVVGFMLVLFGLILYGAERVSRGLKATPDATWRDGTLIGAAQTLALIPGVSRSGVTISAGLLRGFTRQEAARFSFLLSTPAIAGAGLLTIPDAIAEGLDSSGALEMGVGMVMSAIVGWLAIGGLLKLVQTGSFAPFVVYRLLIGGFAIVYFAF